MKILIIGLGNPILTDDGIGVRAAYALEPMLKGPEAPGSKPSSGHQFPGTSKIDIAEASVGGLRLMEMMVDYDKAIIIDALTTTDDPPGGPPPHQPTDLPNGELLEAPPPAEPMDGDMGV